MRLRASENRVQHRLRVGSAVARVSRMLMNAVDETLDGIIGVLADAVGGHRGQLFRWDDELHTIYDGQAEWCEEGIKPVAEVGGPDDVSRLEWWFRRLNEGKAFQIPDTALLPEEAGYLRDLYREAGTRATAVVPIVSSRGKVVGVLGLVDTQGPREWLPEDLEALEVVGGMVAAFWERKAAEKQVALQFRLEACVNAALRMLVTPRPESLGEILAKVANTLGVERAGLYRKENPAGLPEGRWHWATTGEPDTSGVLGTMERGDFPWWQERVAGGKPLIVSDVAWLPTAAVKEREFLASIGVKSVARFPLFGADGGRVGLLVFSATKRPRDWAAEEIGALTVIASVISSFWQREEADARLAHRLAIEAAVTEVARGLLNIGTADLQHAVEVMARALDTQIGVLADNGAVGRSGDVICWDLPGTDDHTDLLRAALSKPMPWMDATLGEGKIIALGDVKALPVDATLEQQLAAATGARAALAVPITAPDGKRLGMIGFGDVRRPRHWLDEDIQAVTVAAGMLGRYWLQIDAEREIRSQARILSSVRDAVVVTDAHGVITAWNRGASLLFGFTAAEAIGAHVAALLPDKAGAFDRSAAITEEIAGKGGIESEIRMMRRDGRDVDVSVSISALRDERGDLTGFVGYMVDITARKKLEVQLAQARKLEALGTLAGGIAHDFNNILGPIVAYTELVKAKIPPGSREAVWLDRSLKSVERARDLVQQILAFSRKAEPRTTAIDLGEAAENALRLIRAGLPHGVKITLKRESAAPRILAEATQIHRILMNLCANSVAAFGERGGEIAITVGDKMVEPDMDYGVRGLKPGRYVKLTVADNGPGIPSELVGKIFDPFFTTKTAGKGTGLGLAVVHGIASAHNAPYKVESTPGNGASFSFYFPLADEAAFITHAPTAPHRITATSGGTDVEGGPRGRLLVIDDQSPVADAIGEMAHMLGFAPSVHYIPEEGVSRFLDKPDSFTGAVIDFAMPGMDGIEVARRIRGLSAHIPIVLCTGYRSTLSSSDIRDAGITECLDKPVTVEALSRALAGSAT